MYGNDFWTLTLHFFKHAVDAGVEPKQSDFGSMLGSKDPSLYRTHDFFYSNPPSRAEFLSALRELPWACHLLQESEPVINGNPWPYVEYGYKRADVELQWNGKVVGRIVIGRNTLYLNKGINRSISVTYDLKNKVLKYVRQDKREEAHYLIDAHRYSIMDRATDLSPDYPNIDDAVEIAIRELLVQHGILKTMPKIKEDVS
jgi:hypothetical protein